MHAASRLGFGHYVAARPAAVGMSPSSDKTMAHNGGYQLYRRGYHRIEDRKLGCQVIKTQTRPSLVRPIVSDSLRRAFGFTTILYASEPTITRLAIKKANAEKAQKLTKVMDKPRLKLKLIGSSDAKAERKSVQHPQPFNSLPQAMRDARELTQKYYDAVKAEGSVLWLTYDEAKGVSGRSMTKWLYPSSSSRNRRRLGLMRRHGLITGVTSHAERPHIREQLTKWDENANERLAPLYKEMVLARAKLAKLSGFRSYLDLNSQFQMLDAKAATAFLEKMRKAFDPHMKSFMESLLESKMKDMDPEFSMAALRHDIWKGRYTIQDFQNHDPKRRLHMGEVSYYARKRREKNLLDGKLENLHESFPLDSTVRGILDLFGYVFGIRFSEVLDQQQYDTIISSYLSSTRCIAPLVNTEKLHVFHVQDTSRSPTAGAYLGILVLDLVERPGKAHNANFGWFADFPPKYPSHGEENSKKFPAYSISAGFERSTAKSPTMLTCGELENLAHEYIPLSFSECLTNYIVLALSLFTDDLVLIVRRLGHAIHHFVRGDNSGVPWDAIEIPSVLCEHWVGNPRILQQLSSHYAYLDEGYLGAWKKDNPGKDRPPKKAPIDNFDGVAFQRRPRNQLRAYQKRLWKMKFDLMVHSYSEEDLKKVDLGK